MTKLGHWAMKSMGTVTTVDSLVSVAVLFGLAGVIVTVGAMVAFRISSRSRIERLADHEQSIPEGALDVLAVVGQAYVIVDAADTVVRANPSAYAFGLVRGNQLGHKQLAELTTRVRTAGQLYDYRFEIPAGSSPEGHWLVHLRAASIGDQYVVIMAEDRSQQHRTEAIRHDFVANVSHELKTPVGAMSLLAEAIEDAADDPEAVRHFASRLTIESMRLAALVQDVISLSRLQGRDIVETAEPLDITRLVSEAIDRVRTEASARDISIHSRHPEPLSVYGDHDQLMAAIRNLIDNAVTYSPDGSTVWVEVTKHDDVVHIAVSDQGSGIAEEDRERIFERFYRVDSARSRSTGGTGLGLSIVKHTVSNHGGEVMVESVVDEGSTFLIRLPALDPEAHEAATEGTEPDTQTVNNGPQTQHPAQGKGKH
ncbi:two-component system sensor histidine kinase SenX3 [Enteractinococcus coprophilus]|uniref:Sensor-like histidine kinase SenX3 n=1 Tax=Enteractinococcus coprophilus TaxID=1027633 RepID=A0A543AFS7_9MICC|nr:two-component system sensor histidine kinase SenX3 [Enteractinococcus coprophilus]